MHGARAAYLHRVCAIDSCKKRKWILLKVVKVRQSHFVKEKVFFIGAHRLHNESFVFAEEEETSRGTACLACLEHAANVAFWVKRLEELLYADAISTSKVLELMNVVANYFDFFVYDEFFAIVVSFKLCINKRVYFGTERHVWII